MTARGKWRQLVGMFRPKPNSSPSADTEDGPQTAVAHAAWSAGGADEMPVSYWTPPVDLYAERNMS